MHRFGLVGARLLLASLVAALLVAVTSWRAQRRSATELVPAYFYPSGAGLKSWDRLARDARSTNIEVILNPASGPGTIQDPNYVAVVTEVRRAGGGVFGYVSTRYGNRDISEVASDIKKYVLFYNINGVFLDEMANTDARLAYYEKIYQDIKRLYQNFKVIGNPGMPYTLESYLAAADTLVIFEGSTARYADFRPLVAAPWVANHQPERFANIVYAARSKIDMIRTMDRANRAHVGSVYITDGELPNPYRGLPRYWDQEIVAIRARDVSAVARDTLVPLFSERSVRARDQPRD